MDPGENVAPERLFKGQVVEGVDGPERSRRTSRENEAVKPISQALGSLSGDVGGPGVAVEDLWGIFQGIHRSSRVGANPY